MRVGSLAKFAFMNPWVPVMLQTLSRAAQERIGSTLESMIMRGKAEMALMSAVFLHRILGDSCPNQILIT